MTIRLTDAEAVLFRTGPNNITILFEASGPFETAKALQGLHQIVSNAERFRRPIHSKLKPTFGGEVALEWAHHVNLINAPELTGNQMMNIARRLALPPAAPPWRALIVNPEGGQWSGVVLHFDHAIADGTQISRHIIRHARLVNDKPSPTVDFSYLPLEYLEGDTDPLLVPPPSALVRIEFRSLSKRFPDASGHSDALLRQAHQFLGYASEFTGLHHARRHHAMVARIEALRVDKGCLGNHARMERVDLSLGTHQTDGLFTRQNKPFIERARLAVAKAIPAKLLRSLVNAEFSKPGVVMTVVPGARKPLTLFGFDVSAVHPAAPVLGRPPLAVTAVRWGDGFDVCITGHGTTGQSVAGLSLQAARFFESNAEISCVQE